MLSVKYAEVFQNPGQMIKLPTMEKGLSVTTFIPEFIVEDVPSFSGSEKGQTGYGSTLGDRGQVEDRLNLAWCCCSDVLTGFLQYQQSH